MKEEKKDIAIFVKNLTSGGAEKQSVIQAKLLAKQYIVHYIIFNGKKVHDKYLHNLKAENGVQIVSFKGCHLYRFFLLVNYLKKNRIRIVFSYLTAANLYTCLACLFCRSKVAIGLRNAQLPFNKRFVDRFLTNHIAILAISNSYAGKAEFSNQGFKRGKIRVISNCFEKITPFSSKEVHNNVNIVTVGRFVKQKDYKTAVAAISLIVSKHSNIQYTIIGYGELEYSIRKWVKDYGIEHIVRILINPDDIDYYLQKSDVYLCTSLFEGTSNSIMEAMNADLPIVCTDVGDNRQLVHDGENGYVCMVEDHIGIAEKLDDLIQDREKRIAFGMESKEILMSNYGTEVFRTKYLQLLDECL